MYHFIVRRNVRRGFQHLSQGDAAYVVQQFAAAGRFAFAGDSVLGGERIGTTAIAAWFQALYHYFPGIQFQIQHIIVNGWPWDTTVATRFSLTVPSKDGQPYTNVGMQFLRISWGRIVEDAIYEDTHKLSLELARRASQPINTAASVRD